jgi:STE24 endopeptidase
MDADAADRSLPRLTVAAAVGLLVGVAVSTPWRPWTPDPPVRADATWDFSAEELTAAADLAAVLRPVGLASLAVSLAVVLWLGVGARGPALVRRMPGPPLLQAALAGTLALSIARIATLPLGVVAEQARQAAGVSTRTWGRWALDVLIGHAFAVATTVGAVVGMIVVARRVTRWWLAAAPLAAGLVLVLSLFYPLVVERAYLQFTPVQDAALIADVDELAAAYGLRIDEVLVADASRRTTARNAYVSGLGPTRRVVLYDTTLADTPEDELRVLLAHELAHAAAQDVLRGTALGAAGAALGTLLIALVLQRAGPGPRRPVPSAAPFLVALIAVVSAVAEPGVNVVSRQLERQADARALQVSDDPDAAIRLVRSLTLSSRQDPDPPPVLHWWFATHPSAVERIAQARGWAMAQQ